MSSVHPPIFYCPYFLQLDNFVHYGIGQYIESEHQVVFVVTEKCDIFQNECLNDPSHCATLVRSYGEYVPLAHAYEPRILKILCSRWQSRTSTPNFSWMCSARCCAE